MKQLDRDLSLRVSDDGSRICRRNQVKQLGKLRGLFDMLPALGTPGHMTLEVLLLARRQPTQNVDPEQVMLIPPDQCSTPISCRIERNSRTA